MAEAGRKTLYTDELNEKAKEYVENYEEYNHPLPSVVGMAVVLKVAKSTLYQWAEDNRGDISDTLEFCNDYQHMELLHKGLKNEFNPTITKLALANHGYHDKQDLDVSGELGIAERIQRARTREQD